MPQEERKLLRMRQPLAQVLRMLGCLESLAASYGQALKRTAVAPEPTEAGEKEESAAADAESRPEKLEEWDASISKDSVEVRLDPSRSSLRLHAQALSFELTPWAGD